MRRRRLRAGWALAGVALGLIVGLAALGVRSIDQGHSIQRLVGRVEHNRTETLSTICHAVNQGREYDRRHETQTRQRAEAEARKLRAAVEGNLDLTPEQRSFARLYVGTVVAIERGTPAALNLNPYRLRNLDCPHLVHRVRAALTH